MLLRMGRFGPPRRVSLQVSDLSCSRHGWCSPGRPATLSCRRKGAAGLFPQAQAGRRHHYTSPAWALAGGALPGPSRADECRATIVFAASSKRLAPSLAGRWEIRSRTARYSGARPHVMGQCTYWFSTHHHVRSRVRTKGANMQRVFQLHQQRFATVSNPDSSAHAPACVISPTASVRKEI